MKKNYISPVIRTHIVNHGTMMTASPGLNDKETTSEEQLGKDRGIWGGSDNDGGSIW